MKTQLPVKTWEKTKHQNLVRHKSGGYYARMFLNGKEIWRSLKTKSITIAEVRLAEARKDHQKLKGREPGASSSKMTFGQAAELHIQRVEVKVDIKRRTRKYWKEIHAALLKSWPDLAGTEMRRITNASCREWAAGYAKIVSATRYNNTLIFLRQVLNLGVESGVIPNNVAEKMERKKVKPKKLELPTLAQFSTFIAEMRAPNVRFCQVAADFAEGLAYTGCRVSEGGMISWGDVNFATGEILIKGDPEEATKNGEIRYIPMIPCARALLERLQKQRTDNSKNSLVFKVRECQKSMNRAAKTVGMARITHHDLRHFFATVCIESGVDIPTVSRWLGHKDGGVLAMKIYGHLRNEHSLKQAQKVSFEPLEM